MDTPAQEPLPVCKQGFRYDRNGFTFAGFRRDSPRSIKKFLRSFARREETRLSNEASKRDKKKWLVGQLRHYGIPCLRKDSRTALEKRLREAIQSRECNRVPDAIVVLERSLKAEWEQRSHDSNSSDEQPCDPDSQSESGAVRTLPKGNNQKISGAVAGEFEEAMHQPAEATMMYRDRLALIPHESLKKKAAPRLLSDLKDIAGSYLIKCDEIESGCQCSSLRIDINPGGGHASGFTEAAFDFSILEGIMRLSMDPSFIYSRQMDDADDENSEVGIYGSLGPSSGMIREQPESHADSAHDRFNSGRAAQEQGKRQACAPTPQTVYFKWRGRETSEGVIQLNYGNDNTGWLQFDSKLATFDGSINIGLVGRNCKLKGFKLSHQARRRAPLWSDFGEQAYDLGMLNGWM